jgi:lysophospholipase L1-like esterase
LSLTLFCFAQNDGLSVLIIGDSNTEHGFISLALADTLRNYFGGSTSGTGYIPLDSSFYEIRYQRVPGVSIAYPNTWTLLDMFEGSRLQTKPYLSPNGQWLKSASLNALAGVMFPGNGIDVYWLAQSSGGGFSIAIDNAVKCTVNTTGQTGVQKTSIIGLAIGNHIVQFKVTSIPTPGNVILLGFDGSNDIPGRSKRPVVHNWGNGWSATSDFLAIDSTVFAAGLQQLAPDIVVVLLGTNDHLQDSRSAADLKANLKALLNRIKAAGFAGKILLVSTFMTNNTSGSTFVPQYRATSWPEAAAETGVAYWDMSTWFGAWNSALMMDGNHCNQEGGKKIGVEMFRQILTKFPLAAIGQSQDNARNTLTRTPWYAHGRLMVPLQDAAPTSIEVFSVDGKRIIKAFLTQHRDEIFSLSVPTLGNGAYYIIVSSNGRSVKWNVPLIK